MMNILVTGGGGFLGSHLARRLEAGGHQVTVLGRRSYPHLPSSIGTIQADLADRQAVLSACRNRDAVFHAGALAGIWGDPSQFHRTNVLGTQNILEGCRRHGISRLVYTSTPSVVYQDRNMENVDESAKYPARFLCEYARTKARAEQMVLDANGRNGLWTVALRPHLIWGPGDPHLVPRLIDRARRGKLVRVGEGQNRVDLNYIDNAVEGHMLAFNALQPGSAVAGKVYFLSDGRPVVLWQWIGQLLTSLGLPPVTRSVSYRNARRMGALLETIYTVFRIPGEPPMTRFLASQLATSHYFDISRARRDMGYKPVVSPEEGMSRLIRHLQAHQED